MKDFKKALIEYLVVMAILVVEERVIVYLLIEWLLRDYSPVEKARIKAYAKKHRKDKK